MTNQKKETKPPIERTCITACLEHRETARRYYGFRNVEYYHARAAAYEQCSYCGDEALYLYTKPPPSGYPEVPVDGL